MSEATQEVRVLFGHMKEPEARTFLADCVFPEDAGSRLEALCARAGRALDPVGPEGLIPDVVEDDGTSARLDEIARNPRIAEVVKDNSWSLRLVEIDRLACFQKRVNVDYAESVSSGVDLSSPQTLTDFCLTEKYLKRRSELNDERPDHLYAIRADGTDLRVLRSREETNESDSSRTISFQVGWGPPFVQVVHLADRYVLKNGYHRAYGIRSHGGRTMPCVLIEGRRYSELGSPGQPWCFGEEKVMSTRPPVFADFFSDEISSGVRMRAQGKVITVQPEEYLMPLDQSKEYLSSLPSHRRPVNLQVEMRAAFLNVSIVKEGWNEYRLEDGTLLWMRQITKRVNMSRASDGGLEYAADNSDPIVMTICPLELMGAPSTGDRGGGDLRGSIVNENMKFTRLMETRNEYLLPTGDRISLVLRLLKVSKTSRFNGSGEPVYICDTRSIVRPLPAER